MVDAGSGSVLESADHRTLLICTGVDGEEELGQALQPKEGLTDFSALHGRDDQQVERVHARASGLVQSHQRV